MSRIKRNVPLIISIVLALLAFMLGVLLDPFEFDNMSSIPSFLFSMVILLIGQIIGVESEINITVENSQEVCRTVKRSLNITKVGTPKSAWQYIMSRLPVIEYVQNTSLNYQKEVEKTNYRLYDSAEYQNSVKIIVHNIEQGLQWRDIGDSNAKGRFNELQKSIPKRFSSHYSCKYITHSEPQIGFILLTYKDGTKEVLFNWDFRDTPSDPTVLLSQDDEIFNMFSAQFNGLWECAVEHYDNSITKSTSEK